MCWDRKYFSYWKHFSTLLWVRSRPTSHNEKMVTKMIYSAIWQNNYNQRASREITRTTSTKTTSLIFFCHLPVSNIVSTCWPTVEKSAIRRQRLDLFMKKKFEFTLTSTSAAWDLDFRDLLSSKDKNLGGESTSTSLLCLVCTILPQFLLMPLRTVSPVSVQPKDCFVLLPPLKI